MSVTRIRPDSPPPRMASPETPRMSLPPPGKRTRLSSRPSVPPIVVPSQAGPRANRTLRQASSCDHISEKARYYKSKSKRDSTDSTKDFTPPPTPRSLPPLSPVGTHSASISARSSSRPSTPPPAVPPIPDHIRSASNVTTPIAKAKRPQPKAVPMTPVFIPALGASPIPSTVADKRSEAKRRKSCSTYASSPHMMGVGRQITV